jgi:hypothetical protein
MANVPRGGANLQPRRPWRPRLSDALVRDMLREIAADLRDGVCLSQREAPAFARRWERAAAGDSTGLRRWLRQQQRAPRARSGLADTRSVLRDALGRVVETRSVLRDAHGRIVGEATSPQLTPEEFPPSFATVLRREAERGQPRFRSPREGMVALAAWLLDRLERRDELWRLRAMYYCDRCGVPTVWDDGRRVRGTRTVCESCRPAERLAGWRRRQARARTRRRVSPKTPALPNVSRGKLLLLSR